MYNFLTVSMNEPMFKISCFVAHLADVFFTLHVGAVFVL